MPKKHQTCLPSVHGDGEALLPSIVRAFLFPLQTGLEEMMWGNIIPTREEQKRLLNDAGFTGTINRSMLGEGFTLLSAQKQ